MFTKDRQYVRFSAYGFLKNLRFFEPFLILFLREQGLTFTQIGLLYAIREITRNLLEVPAGVFADASGRKKSMVVAFSTYLLSFLLYFWSSSFWGFVPAVICFAIGDAFRTGTHKAMILTYLQRMNWTQYKVDYYGHTRSWSQIGSGVSALLAGLVIFFLENYRLAFLLATIPYLINLINLATYPGYLDQARPSGPKLSISQQFRRTSKDFLASLRNRDVLKAMLGLSCYTGLYKAVKDYIQPAIQLLAIGLPLSWLGSEMQQEAVFIGAIYFILFLSTSWVSRHSGQWLRQQKGSHQAMIATLLAGTLAGVITGVLIVVGWNLLAIIFFGMIFLFENLRKPIGISQIADELDDHVLASALSAESQAETVFAAIFALILGIITDLAGLGYGIALTSAIALLMVPIINRLKKNRPTADSGSAG